MLQIEKKILEKNFLLKKLELKDLKNKKIKKNYNIDEMLNLYGFHKSYIKKYKKFCIKAVKRSLNYKKLIHLNQKNF